MTDDPDPRPTAGGESPDSLGSAASEFLSARLELFRLEAGDAGREAGIRFAAVMVAVVGIGLCWLLLLAGAIGWISAANPEWPWYYSALIAAALHLLAAGLAVHRLTRRASAPFPLLRSELAQDREWLAKLKEAPKPRP